MHVAKDRLVQTFKFLKELNELRNPVSRDLSQCPQVFWVNEWPVHPFVSVRRGDRTGEDEEGGELEPLIRVRRANLTPCPKPPDLLDGWLKPGWQSVDGLVEVLHGRNFVDERKGSVTVAFEDDEERITALRIWSAVRAQWIDAELPAIMTRKLFEEIHALWTAMQRESDKLELVLGDGMLHVPGESIRHPVLLQRMNLQFDPAGPEFRLDAGTERAELHRALLRLVPVIEARMIAQFDKELEAAPVEPLGGESTTGFLRRLVQGLFAANGEFLDSSGDEVSETRPTIRRKPVIFVRSRNTGLVTTLDQIIEDLERNNSPAPEALARIVGVDSGAPTGTVGVSGDGERSASVAISHRDILFSKPANAEQYEIAARLAKAKAVLVQGPPGTGKTHTIANLLGCLLAEGKTVLVTAHTTKALRVLRDKVDDALKSLCLSVLDSDAESQEQLKHAAREIASRLSASDAPTLRRDAAMLREKRTRLLETESSLVRQLREARFGEVEELVVGGDALSPIEAARRVKAEEELNAWIPRPVTPQTLCPLADEEVRQLYATNSVLTLWDDAQLSVRQPQLAELVGPADFRLRAAERVAEAERAQTHRPEMWDSVPECKLSAAGLQSLHKRVRATASVLGDKEPWLREVLFAGWSGGELSETWRDLLTAIERLVADAGAAHRLIAVHGPELPSGARPEDVVATLDEIFVFIKRGGVLGLKTRLTRRGWHALLEDCEIDFRAPMFLDKARALRARAEVNVDRARLAARWKRLVTCHGGPCDRHRRRGS